LTLSSAAARLLAEWDHPSPWTRAAVERVDAMTAEEATDRWLALPEEERLALLAWLIDQSCANPEHRQRDEPLVAILLKLKSSRKAPGAKRHPRKGSPEGDEAADRETVARALDELARKHRQGTLLLVHELRALVPNLSKARFDAATLALARGGRAILHHHDHPHALEPGEREQLVFSPGANLPTLGQQPDVYYIGIAPRDNRSGRSSQ
jgi:hypothetical protein